MYIISIKHLKIFSDSKRELNKFEDQWSTTHRSMALDKEKRKRRNKPNGYLAVWPQDIVSINKILNFWYIVYSKYI